MKYFKKMIGKRIYLSPLSMEDVETFTGWVNDLEIAKNLIFVSSVYSLEKEKEILSSMSKGTPQNIVMGIIETSTDKLIGSCGLHGIDHINRTAEYGIMIGDKEYHSKGFGTEAAKLILDFGFNILNLHSIHLKVYSFNHRAISSYQKVGFKEFGRRREAKIIGGKKYDEVCMDILSSEFESVYVTKIMESNNGHP